jgi:2-keto-4-pentenoate hydratase/2-oxohepta-3-ene-1,7-dioic acid hydratase in catechol pathway
LCLFNEHRLGLVEGNAVLDVSAALEVMPPARWPFPREDGLIRNLNAVRARIATMHDAAESYALGDVDLLAPVGNPGKICAAPVNYLKHLQEAQADPATFAREHVRKIHETGLFLKATSAVVGPSEGVRLRMTERRTDHEIELAVVIGSVANRVSRAEALRCVAGYTIGLDITLRGPEERSLRKSIDSYCVLGPWLVTAEEVPDPSALALELRVNGEVRQAARTKDLIIDVPGLIELASSFYTLVPGDVILTGTPAGVGPIVPGDRLTATIDGIGTMDVAVSAA